MENDSNSKREKYLNENNYIKQHVKLTEIIGNYLVVEKTLDGYKALCPFHHEKTPSFMVYESSQEYHCYGCSAHGNIFDFFMEVHHLNFSGVKNFVKQKFLPYNFDTRGLTATVAPAPKKERKAVNVRDYDEIPAFDINKLYSVKTDSYAKINSNEIYEYKNYDGSIAGYKVFFKDSKGKKQVIPVTLYDKPGTGLVWAMVGFVAPYPIFNIDEVVSNTTKPVLLVEGERCATMARSHLCDFVVTTWTGGSNAVDKTDWSILEKNEVFIWPDNDEGGRDAAEQIASQLTHVEIIATDNTKPKGWDIADEIKAGKTPQELTDFIFSFRVPGKQEVSTYESYDIPPGLLGRIVRHILSTSSVEQPNLAIGAALCLMSILQAQKWCTEDMIHPNLFVMGLAKSGIGKSFPLYSVKRLLTNLRHARKLSGGMPVSSAGLVTALHKRQGRMICMVDEFGEEFKAMMAKESPSYQKGILKVMTRLFSESQDEHQDVELADREKNRMTWVVRKPNLVFYGTTVPNTFYGSLNMDSSVNGFLARLLVIDEVDPKPIRKKAKDVVRVIPPELLDELEMLAFEPTNELGNSDPDEYDFSAVPVGYMHDARKLMEAFSDECVEMISAADAADDEFKASLYGRGFEIASKVALLARTNMRAIDKEAVEWAIKLVRRCMANFFTRANGHIHDSHFAKKSKEVENYLRKKAKWVTSTELHNRFRIPLKEMQVIVEYLTKTAIIHVKQLKKKNKNQVLTRTTTSYRFNFSKDQPPPTL